MIIDVVFKFVSKLLPFIMHVYLLIDFHTAVNGPSESIQRDISTHNTLSVHRYTDDSQVVTASHPIFEAALVDRNGLGDF